MLKLPTHSGFHDLFLKYTFLTFNGQNLSLSISETISGDTQTRVDTLKQVFIDLSGVMFVV